MSGLRYWYAENRGTTFAFGLFVLVRLVTWALRRRP